jgi:O-antigen/teichoic acid export membrane protein
LGLNLVTESLVKVVFSIALVFLGFRVYGAMAGVIMGGTIAFFFILISIKEISGVKRAREKFGRIYLENLPILVAISVMVIIYSMDIILARIFFSPELAGKYAFVSLIGKAILFSSAAVGKAMFPMASQSSGKNNSLLKKSLFIVVLISIFALFFFLLFPEQVIKIISLGSSKYTDASNILFISGVSFSFLALSNIIILNKLSGRRVSKYFYYLPVFVLAEIILLSIFNSGILEFSIALMSVNLLIFLYSIFLIRR